jgi:hypothetical protein
MVIGLGMCMFVIEIFVFVQVVTVDHGEGSNDAKDFHWVFSCVSAPVLSREVDERRHGCKKPNRNC